MHVRVTHFTYNAHYIHIIKFEQFDLQMVTSVDIFAYCVSCVVGKYKEDVTTIYNIYTIYSIMLTSTYNLCA